MPRGPKPRPKLVPCERLGAEAPRELRGRARAIYKVLAEELAAEGFAWRCDWRAVALTARAEALAERLEDEVSRLDSLAVETRTTTRVHPLVAELRAAQAQLAALYGALLLTPRSRSASRLTESQFRQAGKRGDELEEFLNGTGDGR